MQKLSYSIDIVISRNHAIWTCKSTLPAALKELKNYKKLDEIRIFGHIKLT